MEGKRRMGELKMWLIGVPQMNLEDPLGIWGSLSSLTLSATTFGTAFRYPPSHLVYLSISQHVNVNLGQFNGGQIAPSSQQTLSEFWTDFQWHLSHDAAPTMFAAKVQPSEKFDSNFFISFCFSSLAYVLLLALLGFHGIPNLPCCRHPWLRGACTEHYPHSSPSDTPSHLSFFSLAVPRPPCSFGGESPTEVQMQRHSLVVYHTR